jgi:hypothetical protein
MRFEFDEKGRNQALRKPIKPELKGIIAASCFHVNMTALRTTKHCTLSEWAMRAIVLQLHTSFEINHVLN